VIRAKWLACLPLTFLSTVVTWASSVLVGKPDPFLSLAAGFIALGYNAVALAGGLADLDPHAEVTERDVPDVLRAALEQVPRKPGNLMGYLGAVLFAVLTGWLCARQPAAALPIAAGCAALAHLALVPASRYLVRMGM